MLDISQLDLKDNTFTSTIPQKATQVKILWLWEFLQVLAAQACTAGYIQKDHLFSILTLMISEQIHKIGINKQMSYLSKVQVE